MAVQELNIETFNQAIAASATQTVVIDFWAPWCGPCRSFAPTFEAASETHSGVVFGKVNTEVEQQLAGALNIRSIPTLMVFREQVLLYTQAGALSAGQLEQLLTQVAGLDMVAIKAEIAAQEAEQAQKN